MESMIFLWLILAVGVGLLADSRGRSGIGFFALSVLLSPLLGLIIVLVGRNPKADEERERLRREEHERQLESIKAIAMPTVLKDPRRGVSLAQVSVADELTKLADLRDRGLLSDAEFQAQKMLLINRDAR